MRSQTYLAKCDRHGCKTMIEIESDVIAPEGWIRVEPEVSGKWDKHTAKEFCSEKCVAIWARDRSKVTHSNGNGNGKGTREQMLAAISVMEGEFEYTDVMELMDDPPSNGAVGQMMRAFAEEGVVKIVKQGGQGIRSTYVKGEGG